MKPSVLGKSLLAERKYSAALAAFQKSIEIDPEDALTHAGIAECYLHLGKDEAAVSAAKTALALDDSLAEAHAVIGAVHFLEQEYELAEKAFLAAVRNNPSHAAALASLGYIMVQKEKWEYARRYSSKSIEMDPSIFLAYHNLAEVALHQGRGRESRQYAQEAFVRRPSILTFSLLLRNYWRPVQIIIVLVSLIAIYWMFFLNSAAGLYLHLLMAVVRVWVQIRSKDRLKVFLAISFELAIIGLYLLT